MGKTCEITVTKVIKGILLSRPFFWSRKIVDVCWQIWGTTMWQWLDLALSPVVVLSALVQRILTLCCGAKQNCRYRKRSILDPVWFCGDKWGV